MIIRRLLSSMLAIALLMVLWSVELHAVEPAGIVRLQRVPGGGIQPQAVAEAGGRIHLIYYKGEHAAGDVYYVRSDDGGRTFTEPLRVNSEPRSAVAAGGVRGAHLALGRDGRVHVAWMGARKDQPGPGDQPQKDQKAAGPGEAGHKRPQHHGHPVEVPMWYTRLDDRGGAFEPQRNLLTISGTLDGGGSVAADDRGNVYVAWHGKAKDNEAHDESQRQVWLRVSRDDGKQFTAEAPVTKMGEGVCACCGMRAFATGDGNVLLLHRSATNFVNRDMMLTWGKAGKPLTTIKLDAWQVNRCPMSTATMAHIPGGGAALAWETDGRVFAARFDPAGGKVGEPIEPPGTPNGRKHPSVAVSNSGALALAWTEGMAWQRGGDVAWRVFDAQGKPMSHAAGQLPGVPAFSLVSIVPQPDGTFVLFY